ncbi:probable rRNA maturation factor [Nitrosomonas oligotropha]|uniref:Endoribonuclease YbeY n=2 Tax=Nitrosomonas oligotropha TaxID=42354 RepID=A0A1H8JR41_9PROT|nr:rRNA maturation RNase YbeY [Nitrosomonas oligotropha]SDW01273.1 probable rRNA maturation factor [Nitrosomonas oligotropha]SEN83162.1 probable rRNA maturation factor [Nitrosomonas oligotropha]
MVQYATDSSIAPTRPQFRRWVKAALMQEAEIVLRLVDEAEGRELNQQFRGKDYATNVLTFVYDEMQPLTGDIVLCAPVVSQEAQQQHKDLLAHYAHLTVHGILHLQGYDHIEDADAAEMEQLETRILAALGYADPYSEAAASAVAAQ